MFGMEVCDWKFVNTWEVPPGPWAVYGDDNTVAHLRRQLRAPSHYLGRVNVLSRK
jgi:hypothetical protein